MAKKSSTQELYDAVRKEHDKLTNIKEFGVQKYSDIWIKEKLSRVFFRSARTIDDIIFYRI